MQRLVLLSHAVALTLALTSVCCSQTYDVVITAGRIYDGSGGQSYVADIGVKDGHITAIGQLQQMRGLVSAAMQEGALGVSSALIYAPGSYARADELAALAEVAGHYGGLYISHIRSEGNNLLEALDELIATARRANVAAELYHMKAAGKSNWDKCAAMIEKIEAARAEGLRITANMYTYTAGATGLNAAMPPWVQAGGHRAWMTRLKDSAIRQQVLREMTTPSDEWENFYLLAGAPESILCVQILLVSP